MGSEGSGISRLLEEECDQIVSIPTCGKIDSLNVSVAAGVLLYERYRQSL
jgi:23S rRNA (guanosine2251-2'-O)-methyltransferase